MNSWPSWSGSSSKWAHCARRASLWRPNRWETAVWPVRWPRWQPVARDLRQISAALKMITDLERIGDQAEDIAEIVISGQVNEGEELLRDMAASTIKMVTESVDAYVKHDTMLAEKVIAEDDIVDDWFDRVKHTLIRRMTADPGEGERAVDLLMVAKYFERIGDHAVNVAQWVIFSVTGTHKEG